VPAYDLELLKKFFLFDMAIKITGYIHIPICVSTYSANIPNLW